MPIKLQPHDAEPLRTLARAVSAAGGRAWLVGGAVRDGLLGREPRDLDVEVHGLDAAALEAVLASLGSVHTVGRSFGVFKVRIGRMRCDVSLPRADSEAGSAPGQVAGAPDLGLAEAARRRDLTINAMAWDPLTEEVCDPCGGQADLADGVLRPADPERFGDDPLRALRVVRFAAVLEMTVSPELAALCRALDPGGEASERIRGEWERIWLGAGRPERALQVAAALGVWRRVFPALGSAPSGATLRGVTRAGALRAGLPGDGPRLALMWGVVLHALSAEALVATLDRLKIHARQGYRLRDAILAIHAHHAALSEPQSDERLRRLADAGELVLMARAAEALSGAPAARDNAGRAQHLGLGWSRLEPLLTGRDLRAAGVPTGPALGELLATVREAQLRGDVSDRAAAMALAERLWSDGGRTSGPGSLPGDPDEDPVA